MNNAKIIWDILIANGCTEAGAAGVIGNMESESALEPCRVQSDFSDGYIFSKEYVKKVDSGQIGREQFSHDKTGGGGFGLCQWTFWSRKEGLYDYCKKVGASIGDLKAQVEYFCEECKRYANVWKTITTTESVNAASDAVLLEYERPADMYGKRAYRRSRGQYYFDLLKGGNAPEGEEKAENEEKPKSEEKAEKVNGTVSIELPILRQGNKGAQIEAAQILLIGYGFKCGPDGHDGDFGPNTYKATKEYQTDRELTVDGVIGPATWKSLLGVK